MYTCMCIDVYTDSYKYANVLFSDFCVCIVYNIYVCMRVHVCVYVYMCMQFAIQVMH
jgi:hypothetical protein